jgi:copper chaperone
METISINVSGMTCMGCVNSVKRVLQALPGVNNVDIAFEQGKVDVQYDGAKIQVQKLKDAITGAGYSVAS